MEFNLMEYLHRAQNNEYFTREDLAIFTMLLNYSYGISSKENKSIIDSAFSCFNAKSTSNIDDEELDKLKKYWLKQITAASQFVLLTYGLDLAYEEIKEFLKSKNISQLKKDREFFNMMTIDMQNKLIQNYNNIKQRIIEQFGSSNSINDLAIFKALRNSICHNDEDDNLYNMRNWGGGEIDLRLTINNKKIKVNITITELDNLLSLYISMMDNNGGGTWVYKITDDRYKPYWGFIYNDKTIDVTDRHQQSYLNRLALVYKKMRMPIRMLHYPSKEDPGLYAYEIYTIMKLTGTFYNESDKSIFLTFIDNIATTNTLLDCESPIERMRTLIDLALLRYLLTNKTSEHYTNIIISKIKSNTEGANVKTDSNVDLYIKKIRNSLVHGRFFIDLIGNKCVFYDQPPKGISLKVKKMSPQQTELYREYIERGDAVDKVKNLVCIGEISLIGLDELVSTCIGQSVKRARVKNILNKSKLTNENTLDR